MMTESNNGYVQEGYAQEESRKRPLEYEDYSRETKKYNTGGNEPLLKLLVPDYVAGALIGKGGALLNELKSTYGGNIRISAGKEYYPGTQERVVVLTGETDQIIDMNNHVMKKVQDPGRESTMKNVAIDGDRAQKGKIVLTNTAAGLLIGRGGLTIKDIQEKSKAWVSISMPDKASVPGERILTMSGGFEERTEACRQIVEILASDSSNMANTRLRYMSGNMDTNAGHVSNVGFNSIGSGYGGGITPYQGGNNTGGLSCPSGTYKLQAKVEVQLEIPDVMVGAILGKQGSIIKDFVHRSGSARFKFSDKSDAADRTLTINGNMEQAYLAYSLVSERVAQLENQPNSPGF